MESKFITKIVHLSLCSLGIIKNQRYSIAYSITIITIMSSSIFGSAVGLFTRDGTASRLEALSAISPQLATMIIYINIYTSKKILLSLLHKIKGNSDHAENVISQADIIIKKKLIWFLLLLGMFSICFSVPPLFASFHDSIITDKNSLAIPFWYSCGQYNPNKILRCVCWRVDTKNELFLANAILSMALGIMYVLNCTLFSLYSVIVGELMMHVECLRKKVIIFNDETMNLLPVHQQHMNPRNRIFQYDQKLYDDFVEIIKYQQFIRRCTLLTVDTWKGYVTVYNCDFYFSFTILLFMTFIEHDDAKLLAIRAAILCMFGFLIASACSYFAQVISNVNENLFDEMVDILWYHQNMKFRKIYITSLTLNRRSIPVKIANMYELNLNSFGYLLRTVYSLLNMLILRYG